MLKYSFYLCTGNYRKMKGLKEYIKKHGKHFTEELAHDVVGSAWSFKEIDRSLQKKVYYNVSGCTSGDIVYYVNGMGFDYMRDIIQFLIRDVLYDVGLSDKLFLMWCECNKDFDFTPYI